MPLKASTKDNLEYLNELCDLNGIEIILPDLDKKKEEEKKETKKEDSK
ncbi:MAG: hypothetical protein J6K21_05895 [Bacilli bacterium]|nr:hypothetical protein [Bacilli bacterium]